jgi:hypothetical protein
MAVGLTASVTPVFAQPPIPYESRDLRRDQDRAARLRADIARDRERLGRARYYGHYREADRIARDIARDQAQLNLLVRDIRRDEGRYYGYGYR